MRIEEQISAIKKRPKMYVKEEKIEYIYYFLLGYCAANKQVDDDLGQKFCCWFWKWLGIWIKNNVDSSYTSKTAYWYDDIKTIAKDERNEIALFYELCEAFFEDYENKSGYFEWRKEEVKTGD